LAHKKRFLISWCQDILKEIPASCKVESAMKPTVFSVSSVEEIELQLQKIRHEGLAPTMAIVFSSVAHNLDEVRTAFAKFDLQVFGASAGGEIVNDEVYEGAIAVMLLDISRDAYRLDVFDGEDKTSMEVGQGIAEWAKTIYDDPALMVMSAGLHADGEQIVNGITYTMGREVPLFGCLAGFGRDYAPMFETFVFDASHVISNGVAALVFDRNAIELQGVAASGWKGIGTPKTITKAEGNIVYRIDDEPAMDIYNKYLNIGDDPSLAMEYPLHLMRDDGSYVMRAVMLVNEDKSIIYGGTVPEGAKVRFSMPPGPEIIEYAVEQITEFNQQVDRADAIVLFSCAARYAALGPMVEDEISGIRKLWNVPLVGFFTFGEIGPALKGRCDFHNNTLVPVLIREK
jgi:hypothetical protein